MFPDGQFIESDINGDSVGASYHAYGLRTARCTDSEITGIDFALVSDEGNSLATASASVLNYVVIFADPTAARRPAPRPRGGIRPSAHRTH